MSVTQPACHQSRPDDKAKAGSRRGPTFWLRRAALSLAFVSGTLALLFVGGFVVFTTAIAPREPAGLKPADGIVVLTGGASRIADGVQLLASGHGQRLLISGVNRTTSQDEIRRTLPDNEHLLDCCVDLGHRALNTSATPSRPPSGRGRRPSAPSWWSPPPGTCPAFGGTRPRAAEVELVAYPVVTDRMQSAAVDRSPDREAPPQGVFEVHDGHGEDPPRPGGRAQGHRVHLRRHARGPQASVSAPVHGGDGKPE